jgi:hypothetical protein
MATTVGERSGAGEGARGPSPARRTSWPLPLLALSKERGWKQPPRRICESLTTAAGLRREDGGREVPPSLLLDWGTTVGGVGAPPSSSTAEGTCRSVELPVREWSSPRRAPTAGTTARPVPLRRSPRSPRSAWFFCAPPPSPARA